MDRKEFLRHTHSDIPIRETSADDANPDLILAQTLDPKGTKIRVEDPRAYKKPGPAVILAKAQIYADIYDMYYKSPVMQDLKASLAAMQDKGENPTPEIVKVGISEVLRQQILLPRK